MSTDTLTWWLDHAENVAKTGDGYTARCPCHDDRDGKSLHITVTSSGVVLVYCFAGCKYGDIVKSLNGSGSSIASSGPTGDLTLIPGEDTLKWWEDYTRVPLEIWSKLGVFGYPGKIAFTWPGTSVEKRRGVGSKTFEWVPDGGLRPWFWPQIPERLPKEIWVTEGESDCGVLRHLGLPSFALTRGAGGLPPVAVLVQLRIRGVERVVLCLDTDSAGEEGTSRFVSSLRSARITSDVLSLSKHLDLLHGEKDLRDLYRRIGTDDLRAVLEISRIPTSLRGTQAYLWDFLVKTVETPPWLVKDIWLTQGIGIIAGAPKTGKTWLGLDLGLSIASKTPFLGTFNVEHQGCVVYIPKEDPQFLLHDRVSKILDQKKFGGELLGKSLILPRRTEYPWVVDLTYEFLFTPERVERLMSWLREISDDRGGIDLVIFDPLLRMLVGVDEFKASEVGEQVFQVCDRIRSETGAGVALLHHRSKSGVGFASYGSVVFRAFSECGLYLTGDDVRSGGWIEVSGEYKSAEGTEWKYRFSDLRSEYQVEVETLG